jgi:hypothetical protein
MFSSAEGIKLRVLPGMLNEVSSQEAHVKNFTL